MRRALMTVAALHGAAGALALYVLMTSFPREMPLVVAELIALVTVAVAAGTLLGAGAARLRGAALYALSVATCFAGHALFVRFDIVLEVLVCGAWRRGCFGRGLPIPTSMLAPQLLVFGVLVAYALAQRRARIVEDIAAKRAARLEAFE